MELSSEVIACVMDYLFAI